MTTFLLVTTVAALVLETGCLPVRLAEKHREIADMSRVRLHEAQRHHDQHIPR